MIIKRYTIMKENELTTIFVIKASEKSYAVLIGCFMDDERYKNVRNCYGTCIFESEVLNDIVIIKKG